MIALHAPTIPVQYHKKKPQHKKKTGRKNP